MPTLRNGTKRVVMQFLDANHVRVVSQAETFVLDYHLLPHEPVLLVADLFHYIDLLTRQPVQLVHQLVN